ncbi:uncharacterized protein [Aegilops tauschii subsp. strangulata]|nr:uncharacterized protein LOC109776055 [Aegilops tauschii subsp. strangulata]XP_044401700.1 uncharacterized protein LOC123125242 [Triticum aestivum]XP_044401701.1 uncharacterized protein LOC123125242 [Triticum aestivum]
MDLYLNPNPADDTTLEFNQTELDRVYEDVRHYIVGVPMDPVAAGFILGSTRVHDVIALHSSVVTALPDEVRYANGVVAGVDKVGQINGDVTILYAKRMGSPLPPIGFADLSPNENECEKVVTLFPYKAGTAIFKGHIVLKDSTSMTSGVDAVVLQASVGTFAFSCPYAAAYSTKNMYELLETQALTVGAAVFNLQGRVVGVLSACGMTYDVKLANKTGYLSDLFLRLQNNQVDVNWLKGEDVRY